MTNSAAAAGMDCRSAATAIAARALWRMGISSWGSMPLRRRILPRSGHRRVALDVDVLPEVLAADRRAHIPDKPRGPHVRGEAGYVHFPGGGGGGEVGHLLG